MQIVDGMSNKKLFKILGYNWIGAIIGMPIIFTIEYYIPNEALKIAAFFPLILIFSLIIAFVIRKKIKKIYEEN